MAGFVGTYLDDDIAGTRNDDVIYGLAGDDRLLAYAGDDVVGGGPGNDLLYGGAGHDILHGSTGQDVLYAGSGNDTVYGGSGNDVLVGGTGQDLLTGGTGSDRFVVRRGTSGISERTADIITDWNHVSDVVDMPIRGTSGNYREAATTAEGIAEAATQAQSLYSGLGLNYLFLHNPSLDEGYLLADLNNDSVFETGLVLHWRGSATDFSYLDIL